MIDIFILPIIISTISRHSVNIKVSADNAKCSRHSWTSTPNRNLIGVFNFRCADVITGIRSIPTVMVFKGGRQINTVVGAVPKTTLAATLDKYITR